MTPLKLKALLDKYDPDWRDADLLRDHAVLLTYLELREQGQAHRWAAMCACQKPPGSKTEREFFAGRHTLAQQFAGNEGQLEAIVAAARRKGFEPSASMIYDSTLADDLGDPKAFISAGGGTTELRRKIEFAGCGTIDGAVRVKPRQPDRPIEAGPLAPDLVQEIIDQKIQENPDLARVDKRDLAADIRHKHGFTDARRVGALSIEPPPQVKPVITSRGLKPRLPTRPQPLTKLARRK